MFEDIGMKIVGDGGASALAPSGRFAAHAAECVGVTSGSLPTSRSIELESSLLRVRIYVKILLLYIF